MRYFIGDWVLCLNKGRIQTVDWALTSAISSLSGLLWLTQQERKLPVEWLLLWSVAGMTCPTQCVKWPPKQIHFDNMLIYSMLHFLVLFMTRVPICKHTKHFCLS